MKPWLLQFIVAARCPPVSPAEHVSEPWQPDSLIDFVVLRADRFFADLAATYSAAETTFFLFISSPFVSVVGGDHDMQAVLVKVDFVEEKKKKRFVCLMHRGLLSPSLENQTGILIETSVD